MNSKVHDAVTALQNSASYYPCLLLVHPRVSELEAAAGQLTAHYDLPRQSVGRELVAALFSVPPAERGRQARGWVESAANTAAPGPLLLTEIDLLFEPSLQIDVLALLRQISRATRLVVAWPGEFRDDVLAYAVPEHHHYRTWSRPDVGIVTLD